jgi:anti-sigma28 factor (negative regulator of flagellin synthesis)
MDAGSGAITAGAITAGSDRTDLSGVADRLSGILQGEASSRADRISQLKADVASGAYRVDANAVSRAMVKETLSASGDSTSK